MNFQKNQKNRFEKDFYILVNKPVFGKTIRDIRKIRNIKPVKNDKRRNYLVFDLIQYSTACFPEKSVAVKMRKTQNKMNKSAYLEFSIPDVSKILMYEFCYGYI